MGVPGLADVPPGPKATMNGMAPGTLGFPRFMRQNPQVANRVLGKERAELWRQGVYKLSDFRTDRTFREISLRSLRGLLSGAS